MKDFASGSERELVKGSWIYSWSEDGRHLVVVTGAEQGDEMLVVDVAEGGAVHITGAWPGGWLEDGSFLYRANVCGSFDIFLLDPETGTSRRYAADVLAAGHFAAVAPDGSRIALLPPGTNQLLLRDPEGRQLQSIYVGYFSLPRGAGARPLWSPDGRYLVLSPGPGKSGPCFGPPGEIGQTTTVEVLP